MIIGIGTLNSGIDHYIPQVTFCHACELVVNWVSLLKLVKRRLRSMFSLIEPIAPNVGLDCGILEPEKLFSKIVIFLVKVFFTLITVKIRTLDVDVYLVQVTTCIESFFKVF